VANDDPFSVTVSRINAALRDPPYETVSARSVTLDADGTLTVTGSVHSRTFSGSLWDSFEVKQLPLTQVRSQPPAQGNR
jgi:hypothetical protein